MISIVLKKLKQKSGKYLHDGPDKVIVTKVWPEFFFFLEFFLEQPRIALHNLTEFGVP